MKSKEFKFVLERDNGVQIAAWEASTIAPAFSFPPEWWKMGLMRLGEFPVVITEGVSLIINGRRQWRMKVTLGAEKRRTAAGTLPKKRCCHDHD